ncbi:NAD(P)-binding domain-containing protein [Streptomyces sp. TRM 70361]|uniref:NAD(P)-dependent oxidoreductase n=1 Tax=Streptomyces sp. TRM 70361 TaxID=3116553 RepID=UPI002E7BABEF|nr:NAD(P)-binding domain-containing protein [Streptomyces sp. TRM 70361]MEE1939706.1 NAD(P)-binding domain-containing protein [Streptomyces sp. TRM 70361]
MTHSAKNPVTVLGLGPMGRALAGALLAAGHPVTVWNRTPGRAGDLPVRGAVVAASAAEAVEAGELVVVCVLDYAAVHAITGPLAASLAGRTLVNLTADTPGRAREAAGWAAAHGIDYLDGAIMVPVDRIGGPESLVLYSGPEELYERHRNTLAALGGTAVHLGTDPGRAASYDIALLDVFWTAMSGVVHAFALARAEGIAAADLAPYAKGISGLLPDIIDEFARQTDARDYPDIDSNLRSAAAGMAHIVETAEARGLDASVLGAAHDLARRGVDAGHGDDSFARLTETIGGR